MDKRKYNSDEVVERVVEALMFYKCTIKECVNIAIDEIYERVVRDIKSEYGF